MLFPFFKESLSSLHLGLINSGIRNTFPMHLSFKVFPRQKSKIAEKMALLCDIVRVIPSRGLYAFFMIYLIKKIYSLSTSSVSMVEREIKHALTKENDYSGDFVPWHWGWRYLQACCEGKEVLLCDLLILLCL